MRPSQFFVWEWLDADGVPRHIDLGARHPTSMPWDRLWAKRRGKDSPLNRWLLSLPKQPQRRVVNEIPLPRDIAYQTLKKRKADLVLLDAPLLDTRPCGSREGGGCARAVVSPDGELYKSVREAGRDLGINAGFITLWCQKQVNGWRYLDDA